MKYEYETAQVEEGCRVVENTSKPNDWCQDTVQCNINDACMTHSVYNNRQSTGFRTEIL